jgi:hypothetical protein
MLYFIFFAVATTCVGGLCVCETDALAPPSLTPPPAVGGGLVPSRGCPLCGRPRAWSPERAPAERASCQRPACPSGAGPPHWSPTKGGGVDERLGIALGTSATLYNSSFSFLSMRSYAGQLGVGAARPAVVAKWPRRASSPLLWIAPPQSSWSLRGCSFGIGTKSQGGGPSARGRPTSPRRPSPLGGATSPRNAMPPAGGPASVPFVSRSPSAVGEAKPISLVVGTTVLRVGMLNIASPPLPPVGAAAPTGGSRSSLPSDGLRPFQFGPENKRFFKLNAKFRLIHLFFL